MPRLRSLPWTVASPHCPPLKTPAWTLVNLRPVLQIPELLARIGNLRLCLAPNAVGEVSRRPASLLAITDVEGPGRN